MFIQGNLQQVFDALYSMGMIDPALQADWAPADKAMKSSPQRLGKIIAAVNANNSSLKNLTETLREFDQETLLFLAMEVARELVDYEERKTLH